MSRNGGGNLDCKVYVGGLTREASRDEIERAFGHYGKLRNVFVARNPPGFAFVEFEDPQDAEDSVRALDGRSICGVRVRVEISHGKSRHKGPRDFRDSRDSRKPIRRRSRSKSFERKRRDDSNSSKSSSRERSVKHSRDRGDRDRDSNGRRKPTYAVARSRSRS